MYTLSIVANRVHLVRDNCTFMKFPKPRPGTSAARDLTNAAAGLTWLTIGEQLNSEAQEKVAFKPGKHTAYRAEIFL